METPSETREVIARRTQMENIPNAAVEAVWEQIAALTPGEKLALFQRLEPEAKKSTIPNSRK